MMPDPSDPSRTRPINRLAPLFGPRVNPVDVVPRVSPDNPLGGVVVDLDEPSIECVADDLVPECSRATTPELDSLAEEWGRAHLYRMFYTLIRVKIDEGEDPVAMRSQYLVESDEPRWALLREAFEDAVAGRPPRYNHPFAP